MATSTLGSGTLVLAGTTSGTTTVTATAVAGTTTLTLPAATDTLVGKATTDTLTNKTLTGAVMNGTLGATTPSTVAATTLTTSSTVTHNGGTANGVAYLNGSKVLTTGSALVFDGTNLGIANTSMGQKLAVNGGIQTNGSASLGTSFGGGAVLSFETPITRMYFGDGTGYSLAFSKRASSTTTDLMTLTDSGNLGIGVTSPTSLLTIGQGSFTAAGANTTGMYTSSGGGGLVVLSDAFTVATRVSGATLIAVGTGGVITSPGTYSNTSGGAANMFVQTDGTFYRSTSSLKYKNNVQDATHGLADLLQLRPVTYEGKAETDAGKTFGGLIAEEVHEAGLTEFVQYAEDGSPDALAYGNMVSLCIKAIQEQQAIITQLTARITALESA